MSLGQSMRQTTAWSTFLPKRYQKVAAEKKAGFLLRCPGLRLLATVGDGPIRGLWVTNGVAYVVSGSEFYSLTTSWDCHPDRHRIRHRPGQHGRQRHPDIHCV
jgi:hypothetical protein